MRRLLRAIVPRPLRNAVRQPLKTLTWWWHETAHALGWSPSVDVTDGWRVRCHPASRVVFYVHRDEREFRDELDAFRRACTPGMVLVDVGAHLGFFTLAALHYGGPTCRVIAVEPSRRARRILNANLRLAGATDRVRLVPLGLGSTRASVTVLTTGAGGLHQLIRPDGPRPDTTDVPMLPLDELVAAGGPEPTHVKIDVEGFERAVLEGGRAALTRGRPVVFLELHGRLLRRAGEDPADVLAILQQCGYHTFESHGVRLSPGEAADADLIRLVCRADSPRR